MNDALTHKQVQIIIIRQEFKTKVVKSNEYLSVHPCDNKQNKPFCRLDNVIKKFGK